MIRMFLFAVSLFVCSWQAVAADYGSALVERVVSVYDADTFRVNVAGWPPVVGQNMPIRVRGIDGPEIRGKCVSEKQKAQEARRFTLAALESAQRIELANIERGKYFRLLADVLVDGESLADKLIAAGLVRQYDGGRRSGWCDQ